MTETTEGPDGELTLRTLAMPADTNVSGDIFGGWVLSQMDIAAGIVAGEKAQGRVATIAVDAMKFIRPVKVGDVLCVGRAFQQSLVPGMDVRQVGGFGCEREPRVDERAHRDVTDADLVA